MLHWRINRFCIAGDSGLQSHAIYHRLQFACICGKLMRLDVFEHLGKVVMGILQQDKQLSRGLGMPVTYTGQQGFKCMAQITNRCDINHAGATFQGVQLPLVLGHQFLVCWFFRPGT